MTWNDCPLCGNELSVRYMQSSSKGKFITISCMSLVKKSGDSIHYNIEFDDLGFPNEESFCIDRDYIIFRMKDETVLWFNDSNKGWTIITSFNTVLSFNKFFPKNNLLKLLNIS